MNAPALVHGLVAVACLLSAVWSGARVTGHTMAGEAAMAVLWSLTLIVMLDFARRRACHVADLLSGCWSPDAD